LSKKPVRFWADSSLLLVTAIWGGTFVMVKDALTEVGPLTFLALRFTLATLVLLPVLVRYTRAISWRLAAHGAAVGLFLFAGYAFQTAGLQFTPASKAGFITGLSVVIVPLISAFALRKPPPAQTLGGVILATVGLALLSLGETLSLEVGDLLVLACAISFAVHILAVGWFAPRYEVLLLTAAQIAAAAALNGCGALLFEAPTLAQLQAVMPAALFTGVLATVAAFYVQTYAQRFTTPTHTALIFTMEPVFAGLFAYLLAGERLSERGIIGCGLILAGMLVAQITISFPNSAAGRTRHRHGSVPSQQSD
jgi:drug/metabolite transporter (DMT)-like permease